MMSASVFDPNPGVPTGGNPKRKATGSANWLRMLLLVVLAGLGLMTVPLRADASNAAPAPHTEDFGQYIVEHEADLDPFFTQHAGDFLRDALPSIMALSGWLVVITMLIGWIVDVVFSRLYASLFAPAYADFKRSLVYATGALVLSAIYTALISIIVVFCLGLSHAVIVIGIAMLLLLIVAFAAQVVWVLYLYRTEVPASAAFYVVVLIVHVVVGVLISGSIIGSQVTSVATHFVDQSVTPKLRAEAEAQRKQLSDAQTARDSIRDKVNAAQNQLTAAQADVQQVSQEIEAKRNSDIYVFSQIVKVRARGDLTSARDQFASFLSRFAASPLGAMAHAQLDQINAQLAAQEQQKQQAKAEAAQVAAQARADLLARAAKGEVTLSEMREALIGKTRAEVGDLLGSPAVTGTDQWSYHQQMIVDPMSNTHYGLIVHFEEGSVQGVDYERVGGGAGL